jgi:hypothetical protein
MTNPGRISLISCLFMVLLSQNILARQPFSNQAGSEKPNSFVNRWSLETSLTFPMASIYLVKFSYWHSNRVELGIGPAFQNWKNEDKSPMGQTNAYTLVMSYRYYFWNNLNAEIEFWPAWNNFTSFVDGKTYKGPELWVEYKIGYRWDFARRFYLNIQPGIGHALWLQQDWPGVDKKPYGEFVKGSFIFVPQVLVGWKL